MLIKSSYIKKIQNIIKQVENSERFLLDKGWYKYDGKWYKKDPVKANTGWFGKSLIEALEIEKELHKKT